MSFSVFRLDRLRPYNLEQNEVMIETKSDIKSSRSFKDGLTTSIFLPYVAHQELFRAMDTDSLVLLYKYHTAFRMLMSNHSTLDE